MSPVGRFSSRKKLLGWGRASCCCWRRAPSLARQHHRVPTCVRAYLRACVRGQVIATALFSRNPQARYTCLKREPDWLVRLLSILPDAWLDRLFDAHLKSTAKKAKGEAPTTSFGL